MSKSAPRLSADDGQTATKIAGPVCMVTRAVRKHYVLGGSIRRLLVGSAVQQISRSAVRRDLAFRLPDFPCWISITDLDESGWPEVPSSRQFEPVNGGGSLTKVLHQHDVTFHVVDLWVRPTARQAILLEPRS